MKELLTHAPDIFGDVEKFFNLSQPELLIPPQEHPNHKTLELAVKLIHEEVNEETMLQLQKLLEGKYSLEIMTKLLDGIVDSIYVLAWTAKALSLPLNAAWHEVQAANMSKFPIHESCKGVGCGEEFTTEDSTVHCAGGRLVRRNIKTGKVMKPQNWKEPDIWGVLFEAWTREYLKREPEIPVERVRARRIP